MLVQDLMTRNVAAVRPDQTLAVAARLMWDCDCGSLPVVEGDRKVIGMITDRDICMACWSHSLAPSALLVREATSSDLVYCSAQATVAAAEAAMRDNQVRRLPVTDAQLRLIGILSLADIARAAAIAPRLLPDRDLSGTRIASTLASISTAPPPFGSQAHL